VGAGQVRCPSAAVRNEYDHRVDLLYHSLDKELSEKVRDASMDYFLLNGDSFLILSTNP
jgi:hypothetical protein